jgi:hypothetical protein
MPEGSYVANESLARVVVICGQSVEGEKDLN